MAHAGWRKVALVVDDEAFARLYAVQILLDQGFLVIEAADVAEGLEMLETQGDVSILFTDISMPGPLDGLHLAEQVRRERPDVALIVTSGRDEPGDGRLPEGAAFLAKPYTAFGLVEAITAAIGSVTVRPVPLQA
jgi:CheY-like chemotaxis protein